MAHQPRHVDEESSHEIQRRVHALAEEWLASGFCGNCVMRAMLYGVMGMAEEAGGWSREQFESVLDDYETVPRVMDTRPQ